MRTTVINGPPECSRTRLPLRNAGAAWFCIVVLDKAGAEKAGNKGTLSPSVTAIAIETCFVDVNILESILKLSGLQALVATGCNRFELVVAAARAGSSALGPNMLANGQSKSGCQLFVKGVAK